MRPTRDVVARHYEEHKDSTFFKDLCEWFVSGKIVVLVLEGENVISVVREMIGATDPRERRMGTIRGDWSNSKQLNLVHGSDSYLAGMNLVCPYCNQAQREIDLWFSEDELN